MHYENNHVDFAGKHSEMDRVHPLTVEDTVHIIFKKDLNYPRVPALNCSMHRVLTQLVQLLVLKAFGVHEHLNHLTATLKLRNCALTSQLLLPSAAGNCRGRLRRS